MPVVAEPISNFETNNTRKGRAGRPSKPGERFPSGKLKPADRREDGPAPALIKRTVAAALRGAADPLYGTSLGQLFLRGEITAAQLAAGAAFARLQGRYDRAMAVPCRFTASADYGVARAISNKGPISDEETAAVRQRHTDTLRFIGEIRTGSVVVAGRDGRPERLDGEAARPVLRFEAARTVSVLERVCVDDLACEGYELPRLRAALQHLVPWFGCGPKQAI